MTKVFIIRLGGPYPRLERLASRLPILGPLVSGLARDSNARRNPRSREYMERAAADAFPEFDGRAMVMLEDRSAAMRDWSACDEIVLLWPDGNGAGWGDVERTIFTRKRPSARVVVVNGRRRRFVLDRARWRRFRARRFLQKTLVAEIAFMLVFVLLTPCLWLSDIVRGRG